MKKSLRFLLLLAMSSLRARLDALVGPKVDRGEDEEDDETTKAKLDKAFKDSDEDDEDFDESITHRRSKLRTKNAPSLADIDQR